MATTYAKEGNPVIASTTITDFTFRSRGVDSSSTEASYCYSWMSIGY